MAIIAAGHRGEKVALPVPTDVPRWRALGDVGADLFGRIGLNVDYQAGNPGHVPRCPRPRAHRRLAK